MIIWILSKKKGDDWVAVAPELLPAVVLPPFEWVESRRLAFRYVLYDTGFYKYQLFLSWDQKADYTDGLGWIFSNTFQIKSGT